MLAAKYLNKHWDPIRPVMARTDRGEWDSNPKRRTTISTNLILRALRTKPQTKEYKIRDPYRCSGGLSYLASMGGEVLRSGEARYPRVGGCRRDGYVHGAASKWHFLHFLLCSVPAFPLQRNYSGLNILRG